MDPYYIHIQKENKSKNLSWQLSKDLCCCVGCQADPKKDKSCSRATRAATNYFLCQMLFFVAQFLLTPHSGFELLVRRGASVKRKSNCDFFCGEINPSSADTYKNLK